jgi:pyranose oxidase
MAAAKRPVKIEERPRHGSDAHYVDWTGVDTILGPLVDATGRCAPGLTILEEHRAERLVPRAVPVLPLGTQRIDHAIVRDLRTLELKEIHAETVVVAAGAFFTPRLLWQSGIRPPALGCYLADNTVATCQLVLNEKVIEQLKDDPDNPARERLIPVAWSDAPPKCGFRATKEKPWIGHINRAGYTMAYDMTTDVRLTLELTWYGTVAPLATNRILFSDQHLDRFGMPQITIEFRLGHDDAVRASHMLDDLAATAPYIGAYVPLSRPPFTKGPTLQPLGTALHIMGTTRMGADAETSVVDPDCRVWGFDNLYLGGNGVIPNEVASNCSLTACAIGVRAAWKLLGCPIEDLEDEVGVTDEKPQPGVAAPSA